ncbi:Vignain [Tetrabaena socialis]|uniref:Vignain n=1 Tax=Tetrabaena socialis TaxID=47790 RepID=A0A2J8AHC8_9CHLO|nr:Vignain [Tetrabaena socialis]|eukprot:PNH11922.1 Vignain [Tetrabaena socialis]
MQFYSRGVISSCCEGLNHGVLAVGFNTTVSVGGGGGEAAHWIVKNSWGAGWGEEGFFRLKMGEGPTGLCEIASAASYPTKSIPNKPVPELCDPFGWTECPVGNACSCSFSLFGFLCLWTVAAACGPGGGSDEGEALTVTAARECLEEAGVEVELQGLADVAVNLCPTSGKPVWRLATFYAVLKDEATAVPKTLPCFESAGACWVGLEDLPHVPLRSPRIPLTFFPHFAGGGQARPLALPEELRHLFTDVDF